MNIKQEALRLLQTHCDEAKRCDNIELFSVVTSPNGCFGSRHSEGVIADLELLSQKLSIRQQEYKAAEQDYSSMQSQLDAVKREFREASRAADLEQKNIKILSARLSELNGEVGKEESNLSRLKSQNVEEADRLRRTQMVASDHMKSLQVNIP
jgi:peptidoglycan hydrolase CwlO-like protein